MSIREAHWVEPIRHAHSVRPIRHDDTVSTTVMIVDKCVGVTWHMMVMTPICCDVIHSSRCDPLTGTRHSGCTDWISRTYLFVWSHLVNLCVFKVVIRALLSGRSPWTGGVNIMSLTRMTGCFSGGLDTSHRYHVIQGFDTSSRCPQVQGFDTSRRCLLSRFNVFSESIRRQVFTFFLTDSPYSSHTNLTHLRGPSGVPGLIGSLLDLMRQNLGCWGLIG